VTEREVLLKLAGFEDVENGKLLPPQATWPIEELGLSTRTNNLLRRWGVRFVVELASRSRDELLRYPYIGPKAVDEISRALRGVFLHLATPSDVEIQRQQWLRMLIRAAQLEEEHRMSEQLPAQPAYNKIFRIETDEGAVVGAADELPNAVVLAGAFYSAAVSQNFFLTIKVVQVSDGTIAAIIGKPEEETT